MSSRQEKTAEVLNEWRSREICDYGNYIKLIRKFKEAKTTQEREKIREVIKGFAQLCGEIPEIEPITQAIEYIELDDNQLQELHSSIQRYLNGDETQANKIERMIKTAPPYKKTTKTYIDDVLFSVKEETVNSIEPPPLVNVSVFENYEVPSESLRKPPPQPEEPKPPPERPQELKIREMLEKNVFSQERSIEQHIKQAYPEICTDTCPYITCPYRKKENFGKKCQQRIGWKINEPDEKSPLTISRPPIQPISLLKRGWNEL